MWSKIYTVILIAGNLLIALNYSGVANDNHTQDSLKAIELLRTAIEFGQKEEPEKALAFFEQSLILRKRVFGEKHYRLGSTYMGMAIQYKNLHQLENAYKFYRIAEEMYLFNIPMNDSRLGDIYSNIGNYFQIKGDLSEAIRYQERAVSIYEYSIDQTNLDSYLSIVFNLANVYHEANRENEALQLVLKNCNKGSLRQQIRYKNLMAGIYGSLKEYQKSIAIHRDILKILQNESDEYKMVLADQYISYSMILNLSGKQDSALRYLIKAEAILKNREHNEGDMADLYTIIADSYVGKSISSCSLNEFQSKKKQNLASAVSFYQKALSFINESDDSTEINLSVFKNSNFPVPTLRILQKMGEVYRQLAYLEGSETQDKRLNYLLKALTYLSTGSDFTEYLRTGFVSEESKLQFTEIQQFIFNLTIEVAFDLYEMTGNIRWAEVAFQNSERNKATSLSDQISEIQSRSASLIPDSLTQTENNFNTKISYYREKLYQEVHSNAPDSGKVSVYKAKIFENEQNLNNRRTFIDENFKEYYEIKYAQKPLTFSYIQRKIKPGEVLLSYSLHLPDNIHKGSLYIFGISKNSCKFIRQSVDSETVNDIITVNSVVSSTDFLRTGIQEFTGYCRSAYKLYQQLILPFKEMISERRVTIVPDGLLCYLPFEALLTEQLPVNSIHFYDLPYFILKNAVNYTYSAGLLYTGSTGNSHSGRRMLTFAPSYPEWSVIDHDTIYLPPIPGIHDEVQYLDSKFRTVSFSGEKATEMNFREQAGKFRILHLATHTLINDSIPMYSRLAFYPEQKDSIADDGWLTTSDIYNLHLNAKMAVLSACRTGSGNLRKGEGIISIAHGFFYAGCPSVLMSLWEVEDRSGTGIIKAFYHNLKLGKPKDIALQNAKISYIRNAGPLTSHPHLWLGYITIGNPEPLFWGVENYLLVIMILIIAGLSFDLIRKKPAGKKPAGPK